MPVMNNVHKKSEKAGSQRTDAGSVLIGAGFYY